MKQHKSIRLSGLLLLLGVLCGFVACNDWTEMENLDNSVKKPWEQDPALWAEYTAALRAYKQSEHFIVFARLDNAPEVATSEKDFMRCLPDSLDIVALTNADRFSAEDAEDMAVMKEKGTKVLYQIDYAGRMDEFGDAAKLGAYLDKVIAAVADYGMDGYSFTGIPKAGDAAVAEAAALMVSKLSADEGKLLIFEGNPLFVAADDRSKVDYFILDTDNTEDVLNVKFQIRNATGYAAVPAEKLLLAAAVGSTLRDEDKVEFSAVDEMSRRVISFGPLRGLAAYDIDGDYYSSDMNYKLIRQAIQTLNPSK